MMNIYDLEIGDKIKCINNEENTWGDCDSISKHLTVGETYTLDRFRIHSWHTKLWFKEKPGLVFNSVHFVEVEK